MSRSTKDRTFSIQNDRKVNRIQNQNGSDLYVFWSNDA